EGVGVGEVARVWVRHFLYQFVNTPQCERRDLRAHVESHPPVLAEPAIDVAPAAVAATHSRRWWQPSGVWRANAAESEFCRHGPTLPELGPGVEVDCGVVRHLTG